MKRIKRTFAAFLAVLCLLPMLNAAAANIFAAVPISSGVLVDGKPVNFQAYQIAQNNYFKLRDIAYVLRGTSKEFAIFWDSQSGAILLDPGSTYTPGGEELSVSNAGSKTATAARSYVVLNNTAYAPAMYTIDNSNYFKLRDLGKMLDFFVAWDGASIYIDSTRGYDYEAERAALAYHSAPLVPAAKLKNLSSLKKGMTNEQFSQAYSVAAEIAENYRGLTREEQLRGIFRHLRYLTDTQTTYSTRAAHYNDVYGFFVLHVASCAGATRAVGLCLNLLGIPYEHVNENQWGHQWCRVKVGDEYWICDSYGLYVGPEPAPYTHPNM